MDNLDRAYKIVKRSSLLWVVMVLLLLLGSVMTKWLVLMIGLGLVVVLLFFYMGVLSMVGVFYAMKGSQYNMPNPKKRFFGLFGNLLFVVLFLISILTLIEDILQLLTRHS